VVLAGTSTLKVPSAGDTALFGKVILSKSIEPDEFGDSMNAVPPVGPNRSKVPAPLNPYTIRERQADEFVILLSNESFASNAELVMPKVIVPAVSPYTPTTQRFLVLTRYDVELAIYFLY
jgi:hypothetical protein